MCLGCFAAEELMALHSGQAFCEVVVIKEDDDTYLTAKHPGTLQNLLLVSNAAAMASEYPALLQQVRAQWAVHINGWWAHLIRLLGWSACHVTQ
jgi:hypothetical protein